jgi:hypothetical protein
MTHDDFMCSTGNPLFPSGHPTGRAVDRTVAIFLVRSSAADKRSRCLQYSGLGKDGLDVGTRQHFKITVGEIASDSVGGVEQFSIFCTPLLLVLRLPSERFAICACFPPKVHDGTRVSALPDGFQRCGCNKLRVDVEGPLKCTS